VKLLFIVVLLGFFFAGCSSTKTVEEKIAEAEAQRESFELNGDSDSLRAGPLRSVYFELDKHELDPVNQQILDNNLSFLQSQGVVEIVVEGHADERGPRKYNVRLAKRRAEWVRNYLINRGVSPSRVSSFSFGAEKPVDFAHTEGAWAKNRRANFIISKK